MRRDHNDVEALRARVESLADRPALIRDRHLTVLASNTMARALSPGFDEGVNLARYAFIDAVDHAGDAGWYESTSQIAAMLRDSLDIHRDDAPFRRIVGELSARSPQFSVAWADEAAPARQGEVTFVDTAVGDLTLVYREEWLDDTQAEAIMLLSGVDAASETKLDALASILAGRRPSE
ncbi:hypothetical protein [Microbacterium sp. NPDC087665]|uniref:MmyB family transcriptional regulator n=1 Tax=Microbacterium sp. NPDC087665 TaxID=3364194 RepID=UPI00380F3A08